MAARVSLQLRRVKSGKGEVFYGRCSLPASLDLDDLVVFAQEGADGTLQVNFEKYEERPIEPSERPKK
jgi:hypothetical protein